MRYHSSSFRRCAGATLLSFSALCLAAPRASAQQAVDPTAPRECTTTTTTTTVTRCTGDAAPLAVNPPATTTIPAPPPPVCPPPVVVMPPYPYPPPQPQPAFQLHYEMRPRWGLFAGGLVTFGTVYLLTAMVAMSADRNAGAVPLVGPLFYLSDDGGNGLLLLDTLIQTAGLAMMIGAFTNKKKVAVWDRVAIVPTATPTSGGLAAVGVF